MNAARNRDRAARAGDPRPRVGLWIAGDSLWGGGGAERRFGRMAAHLCGRASPWPVYLLMSSRMRRSFAEAGIALPDAHVISTDAGNAGPSASAPAPRGIVGVGRRALRESRQIRRLCQMHGLDVVHFLAASYFGLPFLLCKPRNVAVAFSVVAHGYLTAYERLSWKARLALRLYLDRADAIDSLYSGFEKRFPRYADKALVTPCSFTDYGRFSPAPVREKWVVFAGRLEKAKNPLLFLDALDRISTEMRAAGWKAFLLGGGGLQPEIEAFIRARNLGDLVTVERVVDTATRLCRSGIYVSLQDGENYPSQSLLEAMAAGNAVVATDVGDTRRLVGPESGLLIPAGRADELASALQRLMGAPEIRAAMGAQARAFVVERHSVERAANHLLAVWEQAHARRVSR